ncbi:MAG: MFS transporter, partial [Actinomycetota bacterium]
MQTFSMLPMFLVGALAVQIRSELAFGPAVLGAVTASFVLSRAVTSVGLGGWVDRLGAIRSLRLAGVGASAITL